MTRRLLIAAFGLLLASTAATRALAADKLVLFQNQSPISGLTIVAAAKGFFQANGLDVEVRNVTTGKLALDALIGGSADLATVAETPVMRAGLASQPLAVVATMEASDNDVQFLVRTDRGIKSLADLKGKTIATAVGTSAEYLVYTALLSQGAQMSDATIINLRPEDMATALLRGDVDAYAIWQPHTHNGQRLLGTKAAVLDAKGLYTETFNIVGMAPYVKAHPDIVQRFLKSLLTAEDYMASNREDAIRLVAAGVQLDEPTMAAIWGDFKYHVGLDAALVDLMVKQAHWDIASGKPASVKDIPATLQGLVDPAPLKAVAPDRVSGP